MNSNVQGLAERLAELERLLIIEAIAEANGRVQEAAERLKLPRKTLSTRPFVSASACATNREPLAGKRAAPVAGVDRVGKAEDMPTRSIVATLMALALALATHGCMTGAPVQPTSAGAAVPNSPGTRTVLFIGNSFTFGGHSAAQAFRSETVDDMNGHNIGGVPALFELLTEQAGLDHAVSLETSPGKSLEWHWENKRALVDGDWDYVILQEYSTLDRQAPGNPAKLIDYAGRFARLFAARNPEVDIGLAATWGRADLIHQPGSPWSGSPIERMALELRTAADAARAANPAIDRVVPIGEGFNCAFAAGFADPNPYDGIAYDQINLWASDHYHASEAGSYLSALITFASLTGQDPRQFGAGEIGADELGISDRHAVALQAVAWATVQGHKCDAQLARRLG